MLTCDAGQRIWLCTRPTDMRRSFDGLSAQVRNLLGENPASGHWFVFVNRRGTMLKILAFDTGGYWVWAKRWSRGASRPGARGSDKCALTRTALLALIEGADIVVRRQRKRYRLAAREGLMG